MAARAAAVSAYLLVLAGAGACTPADEAPPAAPAVDSAMVVAAVADVWRRWIAADTAGDAAAISSLVTADVRMDAQGYPPILGRAMVDSLLPALFRQVKIHSLTMTPEATMAISNELAYETGDFVETATRARKRTTEYGRYAAAVAKDADGQWRLAYWMGFADSTVAAR